MISLPGNNAPILEQLKHPFLQLLRTLRNDIQLFSTYLPAEWNDELSDLLRIWQKNCVLALGLRTVDHQAVVNTFLDLLEEILMIPVLNIPLDEEAMLGSDGEVYGKQFLCLHRHFTPEPYNLRSPLAVEDPRPLMVRAHEPARMLVQWIKRYRPNFGSQKIDSAFQQLPAEKKKLPETSIRVQKFKLDQFSRNQAAEKRKQQDIEALKKFETVIDDVIVPQVAAFQQKVKENHAQANARLDKVETSWNQETKMIIEELQKIEKECEIEDQQLVELAVAIEDKKGLINEAKKDNLKLQSAINDVEKEAKRRKRRWLKELVKIIVIVAASWAATWALQAIAEAAGFLSAAAPTTNSALATKTATTAGRTIATNTASAKFASPAVSSLPNGFKLDFTVRLK